MNKLGVAPSRPLCHVFANCLCLYRRPNPQASLPSCSAPMSTWSFASCHRKSPQGSGVGHWLAVSLPDSIGLVHPGICVLCLCLFSWFVESGIYFSISLSSFSLFWGLSEKVWRSKPFTGNYFLVSAGVDAEGFYSSSLGSCLCFVREKWVAISLGGWALFSICGFGIPFPRFFGTLQNPFCVKALPLD